MTLYEEANACLPHSGDTIKTAKGEGKVVNISALKGQVKLLYADTGANEIVDIEKCQKLLFPERSEVEAIPEKMAEHALPTDDINIEIALDDDSLIEGNANEESELFNDTESEEEV
jgi:cell fate regulator YaaT (PSP1 superfamily)